MFTHMLQQLQRQCSAFSRMAQAVEARHMAHCKKFVEKYFPTQTEEDSQYAATWIYRLSHGIFLGVVLGIFFCIIFVTETLL